jgi:predicted enzyme related to lactoylglutathione lyase
MSDTTGPTTGAIVWTDLTVPNADAVRDFYREVAGWGVNPVEMGGYQDYTMISPVDSSAVAGVCHARGMNAGLPSQWLIYISVADLDESIARCSKMGGAVVFGPKSMGQHGRYCVVRDPSGAVAALIQPAQHPAP